MDRPAQSVRKEPGSTAVHSLREGSFPFRHQNLHYVDLYRRGADSSAASGQTMVGVWDSLFSTVRVAVMRCAVRRAA